MSFVKKAFKKEDKQGNDFKNLNRFFEEIRRADSYEINRDVEKLQSELEKFFEESFESILLEDFLLEKNKQKDWLEYFNYLKNRFYMSLYYPWMFNKKRIVIAGGFNAGKSSIINKLMNSDILPTNVRPTTAISTQITKLNLKNSSSIIKTINYGLPKIIRTDILKFLVKEEIEKFPIHLADLIEYVVINNDILGNDLIIIDTPGFDPADKKNLDRDKELMQKEFDNADCIVWVMDANSGDIGKNSLDILQTIDSTELIVIVNKGDTTISSELTKIVKQVKKTLTKNNIKYLKIITMGETKKGGINFNQNINTLKNLIKNIKVEKLDIFEEIEETLEYFYKELKDWDNYLRGELTFYENLSNDLDDNFWETFPKIANWSLNDDVDETLIYISELAKGMLKHQNKIDDLIPKRESLWQTEFPMFGDDKYYILFDKKGYFDSITDRIEGALINRGWFEGRLKMVITNNIENLKDKLKKIDSYVLEINKAKRDIQKIKHLYQVHQCKTGEEKITLNFF